MAKTITKTQKRGNKKLKLGRTITKKPEDSVDFVIDTKAFLSSHTFLQGISGSAKTGTLLKLLEEFRKEETQKQFGYIPFVIADEQDEFLDVPETYPDFVVIEKDSEYGKVFTVEHARKLGEQVRKAGEHGRSVILKLSDFKTEKEMEEFLSKFIEGFRIKDRQYWNPVVFMIDEADIFASRTKKISLSRDEIIGMGKRGRKEGISMVLATQNSASVHMDARSQCANRIIGNTAEPAHKKACVELLDLDKETAKKLFGMREGEFFFKGKFTDYQLYHVQVDRANIKTPEVGIARAKNTSEARVNALTIDTGKDISVIDALESKIGELRNQILNLEENQLSSKKIEKMLENEYSRGYTAHKELSDNNSISKLLKRKIGV